MTGVALRILILGRIPDDLRRDLRLLDDDVELVAPEREVEPSHLPSHDPHLLVLGASAPFTARAVTLAVSPLEEPVPVLALGSDPGADLCLPREGLGRDEILRLARRLARMRRALGAGRARRPPEAEDPAGDPAELFRKRLEYEFSRALRYRHPVSLVTVCVDGRERLTSMYGDAAVEEFVSTLEGTLNRGLRDVDLLFRASGDEIAAILPETPASGAALVADRFLAQTSRLVFKPTSQGSRPMLPLKTTSSIGVADGPGEGVHTPQELLVRARESMGNAQLAGGGRIVVHGLTSIGGRRAS